MSEGIHLFSNGTEFEIWEHNNCSRCVKEPTCDLLAALFTDGLAEGMYQGQVLPETAARLGYSEAEHGGRAGWLCKERQTHDTQPPAEQQPEPWPPPAVEGEPVPLPGFDVPERPAERGGYPS
jgi:hypothetical protein